MSGEKDWGDDSGSLDRQLRRAGRNGLVQPESTADCLDPEILAAWTDGQLPARERSRAEAHAAECARCQELLAALVRTAPDARTRGRAQAGIARPRRFWLFRPEWIVSIAAAACIMLAVATGLVWRAPWTDAGNVRKVGNPGDAAKTSAAPATVERGATVEAPRQEIARAQSALQHEETAPAAPTKQPTRTPERAEEKDQTLDRLHRDDGEQSARMTEQKGTVAAAAPANAAADTPSAPAPFFRASRAARPADKAEAAKKVEPPPAAPRSEQRELREEVQITSAAASNLEIVSTDSSTRWRIVRDSTGAVEHSTNGGQTWETLQTAAPVIFRAGASPSPAVCWLVGGRGVVVLITDGRTWRRADVPSAGDLVGIRAMDDKTATVTAADGQSYRTIDGGRSWKQL